VALTHFGVGRWCHIHYIPILQVVDNPVTMQSSTTPPKPLKSLSHADLRLTIKRQFYISYAIKICTCEFSNIQTVLNYSIEYAVPYCQYKKPPWFTKTS
tara:strand:+ start:765 stop:1061 length:297 start_codon:yes stop_codon:yes gene_type:complete